MRIHFAVIPLYILCHFLFSLHFHNIIHRDAFTDVSLKRLSGLKVYGSVSLRTMSLPSDLSSRLLPPSPMNVTYSSSVILCFEIARHKHGGHCSCSLRYAVWVARLDRAEPRTRKNKEEVYVSVQEDSTKKLIRGKVEQNKARRSGQKWKEK